MRHHLALLFLTACATSLDADDESCGSWSTPEPADCGDEWLPEEDVLECCWTAGVDDCEARILPLDPGEGDDCVVAYCEGYCSTVTCISPPTEWTFGCAC